MTAFSDSGAAGRVACHQREGTEAQERQEDVEHGYTAIVGSRDIGRQCIKIPCAIRYSRIKNP
jgi:hypothetical protein